MKNNIYSRALEKVWVLPRVLNHLCLKWIQGYYYYQPLQVKHHDCLMIIFQENENHEYLRYVTCIKFSLTVLQYYFYNINDIRFLTTLNNCTGLKNKRTENQ